VTSPALGVPALKQISVEWMPNRGAPVSAVIAGLDPAIHLFRKNFFNAKKMDPRVKPAGDAAGWGKYWINSTGPRISERKPAARLINRA
jgi:hypothetical protein